MTLGIGIAIGIGIVYKIENIFQTHQQIFDSDSDPDTDTGTEELLLSTACRDGLAF